MAFGFGFNKQKVLSAAEKFVQQGKLQNAIAEYEKILKNDPKDLTVMNTVGDLYSRDGQSDKALQCFKNVGDAYATQGFTVKAIAMYKKLTKLKSTLEGVLRLAELYTQQGLFNDARAQYLQVAEEFLRAGELEQAVRIFQKTLEMDPENVAMKMRLAEVYIRLGKKTEAWQIFAAAAESLRSRGQLGPAEEILQRMLTLDPGNSYALLMRGGNALESGDATAAIKNLEKVADLDSHPDGMRTLMQAYLQTGRLPDVGTMASKLFTVHNDVAALTGYVDALMSAGQFDEALKIYQQYADRLLATDSAKVLETLHGLIGHVRENTAALESLLELFHKAGDTTHLTEVYELLAHAYTQAGKLEKARDYYLQLTQLEPQNQLHARNYQQVVGKLGGAPGSRLITAEEGAVMVDELEATAASIDQRYPDEVALAVRAALTDAELFVSYNMPAKALGPLLSVVSQAPRDVRLNQRLAALHTRASRFAEASVCCRTLESVYHDAGYPDEATRYGELAGKYEERASARPAETGEGEAAPPPPVAAAAAAPATPAGLFWHAAVKPKTAESPEFEVQPDSPGDAGEIDLSQEWEGELTPALEPAGGADEVEVQPVTAYEAPAESEAVAETIEEIRFYLAHSMAEQARIALRKLERLTHDTAQLAAMRDEIEAATAQVVAEPEAVEEVYVEEEEPAPPPPAKAGHLDEFVADLESSLGDNFLPPTAAPPIAKHKPEPQAVEYAEAAAGPEQKAGELGEFVADLESSLGDGFLTEPPPPEPEVRPAPVASAPPKKIKPARVPQTPVPATPVPVAASGAAAGAAPALAPTASPAFTYQPTKIRPLAPEGGKFPGAGAGVDLAEMFGELKQDLEEDVAKADEDAETHYNLGVAFREMGLLDEAIGELQKVCQAVDRGQLFPQIMQTYTWLAQCFLDKGVPEAAIRWYERALKLSDIDEDTKTALHYELASAYESAQDKPAALHHFMEVYGSNIDYRDVAERIKALKS
jgi:tetratricopeptide (TPR) repeat protein